MRHTPVSLVLLVMGGALVTNIEAHPEPKNPSPPSPPSPPAAVTPASWGICHPGWRLTSPQASLCVKDPKSTKTCYPADAPCVDGSDCCGAPNSFCGVVWPHAQFPPRCYAQHPCDVLSPISGNYYVLDVFTFEGDTPPAFEARTVGLPALPIDGSVDACCRACWDNTLNCLAWTFNPGLGQCTIQVATALVKTGAPRTAQCPNGWLPNGFILWHGFEIDTQELQTYAQRGPCLAYTHWNGF